MPSVEKWSETPASNSTADSDIVAAEGMAPSAVNDSLRGIMAGVARWNNDASGEVQTAGTSTAYTFTSNQTLTAYANGIQLAAIIDETNTGASTLNVDSLGAKNIYKAQGSALVTLAAGDLVAGMIAHLYYNTSLNASAGGWFLANPAINTAPSGSQPLDATLTALAGVTTAADTVIYATGSDAFTTTALTSTARTLLDDTSTSAMRTTLGVAIGSNVQAWDADLDAIAALAKTDGNFIVGDGAAWVAESGATARTSLGLGTSATVNTGTSGATIPLLNATNTVGAVWTFGSAPIGVSAPDIILEDQQTSGTDAGTFTSGADQTRVLNTEVRDTRSECSLSANRFTLTAGTYYIEASAPARGVDSHQAFIYNVTGAAEVLRGTTEYTSSSANIQTTAYVRGTFTIAASQALELRHRCGTTKTTTGLGTAAGIGTERYAAVRLWRLS